MWLVVANVNLIAAVAGGDTVWKFHSFHDAELVQNCPSLLAEDNHSLDLALHNDDVAKSINRHSTWILQDVRPKLSYESTVSGKYLNLQAYKWRMTKHAHGEYLMFNCLLVLFILEIKKSRALSETPISELQGVTSIWDHSVTCHMTQVKTENTPH